MRFCISIALLISLSSLPSVADQDQVGFPSKQIEMNGSCVETLKQFTKFYESSENLEELLRQTTRVGSPSIEFLKKNGIDLKSKLPKISQSEGKLTFFGKKMSFTKTRTYVVEGVDCKKGKYLFDGKEIALQQDLNFIENLGKLSHMRNSRKKSVDSALWRWQDLQILPMAFAAHPNIPKCFSSWLNPREWPYEYNSTRGDCLTQLCHDDFLVPEAAVLGLASLGFHHARAVIRPNCAAQIKELRALLPKGTSLELPEPGANDDVGLRFTNSDGSRLVFNADFDTSLFWQVPTDWAPHREIPYGPKEVGAGVSSVMKLNSSGEVSEYRKGCGGSDWLTNGPEFEAQKKKMAPYAKVISYLANNESTLKCGYDTLNSGLNGRQGDPNINGATFK